MKTIVHIDLNDAELNRLACRLAGKEVKRTATRKEGQTFVQGSIDRATRGRQATVHTGADSKVGDPSQATIDRAREIVGKGFNLNSYLHGWRIAG